MNKLLRDYNILWALLVILLLPAVLTFIMVLLGKNALHDRLKCCYKLHGMTETSPSRPPLDIAHIKSHEVQQYVEEWISNKLPLRSFFIRLNNQAFYSLFKKSFSDHNQLIIGKSNQLFEKAYVNAYCLAPQVDIAKLEAWVDKLQELNFFFKKQGKTFIYVITPSKAEYMADSIPSRFHCPHTGMSPHIEHMTRLLKERNIPYMNGSQLMLEATKQLQLPLFPRGGIHWNDLGASLAANAIIKTINQTRSNPIQTLQFNYTMTQRPYGPDRDLMNLLNLIHPDDSYTVAKINFNKAFPPKKSVKISLIGGSFLEQLVDIFWKNKTFSQINYYRYFKLYKKTYDGEKDFVQDKVDPTSSSALTAILAADIIVLEENVSLTLSEHGALFYDVMKKFAMKN